jgi:hypothetical protein
MKWKPIEGAEALVDKQGYVRAVVVPEDGKFRLCIGPLGTHLRTTEESVSSERALSRAKSRIRHSLLTAGY